MCENVKIIDDHTLPCFFADRLCKPTKIDIGSKLIRLYTLLYLLNLTLHLVSKELVSNIYMLHTQKKPTQS